MFLISFFKALGRNSRSLINFANVCMLGQTIITLFEKKVMPDCCISASTCLILSGGGGERLCKQLNYYTLLADFLLSILAWTMLPKSTLDPLWASIPAFCIYPELAGIALVCHP